MMKKILAVLFIMLVMQTVSYSVWYIEKTQDEAYGKYFVKEEIARHDNFLAKELKLSSEQKLIIQKIKFKYQKELLPIESRINELSDTWRKTLLKKDIDEQKVIDVIGQIGKNEIIFKQMKTNEMLEIFKILTEEQQQKVSDSKIFSEFWDYELNLEKEGKIENN